MRRAYRKCYFDGTIHDINYSGPCTVDFEQTWIIVCHREDKCSAGIDGCSRCDFRFKDRLFHDPVPLASALAADWEVARRAIQTNSINRWAADALDDSRSARQIKAIAKDSKLDDADGSLRLSAILLVLDRTAPLFWRGEEITRDWIEHHSADSITILNSSLPGWADRLRAHDWLATLGSRWAEFRALARRFSGEVSETTAFHWLLKAPEQLRQALEALREEFADSTERSVTLLLKKELLSDAEAILLLSFSQKYLRSREKLWKGETGDCKRVLEKIRQRIQFTPTDGKTLETLRAELETCVASHLATRDELSSRSVVLVVADEIQMLTVECRAEVHARVVEHERQRELRTKLKELTDAGRVRDAEELAGNLSSEFTDLELNPVYRIIALFRRLRLATKLVAGSFLAVVLLAVILKLREAHSDSLRPMTFLLPGDVQLRVMPVVSGQFQLGSLESDAESEPDERPLTTVMVRRRFWLGETEVTQAQWKSLMGTDVLAQQAKHNLTNDASLLGDDLPMVCVSWDEALAYCSNLQASLSRENRRGIVRLPTEAEWEYACRAGTKTPFSFGLQASPKNARFAPSEGLARATSFEPNAWGFWGMHGNASEWVSGAPATYPGGIVTDWFIVENNKDRLHRGGSWRMSAIRARSAARNWRPHGGAAEHVGFRIVWEPAN